MKKTYSKPIERCRISLFFAFIFLFFAFNVNAQNVDNLEQADNGKALYERVSCFGGSDGWAQANATGGLPPYSYLWSDGQTTSKAVNLMAGAYAVTITDANGCTTTCEVEITQPPLLSCEISDYTIESCEGFGGTATVSVYGGTPPYTYLWSDGQTTATCVNLMADIYTVTVTDANGCTTECSVYIPQDYCGCTYTQGYWRTHSKYGPAPYDATWALLGEDTPFFLSGMSYYKVMWTPPRGNAFFNLAVQYIAAELNFLNDAYAPAEVTEAFDRATVLFQTYTPAQIGAMSGNNPVRAEFIKLASILDAYNNGKIGPGHCDDVTTEFYQKQQTLDANHPDQTVISAEASYINVFPNPFRNSTTIIFSVANDTHAVVEVYTLQGTRVAVLFDEAVSAEDMHTVTFTPDVYTSRQVYLVVVRTDYGRTTRQILAY